MRAYGKPRRMKIRQFVGDDGMNKTEREFAQHLAALVDAGEIVSYRREPIQLRIADRGDAEGAREPWYKPDFAVQRGDGQILLVDVKGGTWARRASNSEAWRLRVRAAASVHIEYAFVVVYKRTKKQGAGWESEFFSDRTGWDGLLADRKGG